MEDSRLNPRIRLFDESNFRFGKVPVRWMAPEYFVFVKKVEGLHVIGPSDRRSLALITPKHNIWQAMVTIFEFMMGGKPPLGSLRGNITLI